MNWLKKRILKWLGLQSMAHEIAVMQKLHSDLVSIGVDVHFKSPHMILIYSHLKGGQIRHVPAHFDNMAELAGFVKELKARYRTRVETWDKPWPAGRF